MKLISWNVNGLRACLTHDFAASFAALDADVFSVQETKMQPGQADFAPEGYTEYTYSAEKKGYSGTACWCKTVPLSVTTGVGIEEHDHKGDAIEQAVLSQNTDPSRQAGDCKQQAARHVQVHMHLSAVLFLDLRLTVPVILHFQPAITQELLDLVQRCLPSFCKIPVILFLSKKIPILFYCTTKIHRMILFFNHFPGKG